MSGTVLFAFVLWLLLTSDFSWGNVSMGLIGALLVSWVPKHRFSVSQLVSLVAGTLLRVPLALWQALYLICNPGLVERVERVPIKNPENPWSCFRQVFLITFTPKSVVISDEQEGQVQLHSLEKEEAP